MEPSLLTRLTIGEFLDQLAATAPTPGGGAAAALAGALAAGLMRMVAGYTLGRAKFADVAAQIEPLAARAARAGDALRELIDEDAAAYAVLADALKLPKDAPSRAERVEKAALLAGCVPLETATLSARVLEDAAALGAICNPMLRSDAHAAQHLARAAVRSAAANVEANLPLMSESDRARVEPALRQLLARLDSQPA